MKVEPFTNTAKLECPPQRPDLRRDLHVFVNYVRGGDIKRAHRGNVLQKNDARRLAKLMSDPTANDEVEQEGNSAWVDFVDDIAFGLGFVKYDTKGVYAGYTSEAPSFPDNFIEFQAKSYDAYLEMSLAGQESVLLQALLERYTDRNCELFYPTMFSRLDRFSSWGSATGVIPTIDFPNVRHFLLNVLAELPTGEWLSTASLVAFLKKHHRYFLIPEKPQIKNKWETNTGRYDNFHEGDPYASRETTIKPSDPDAFERAEGRYVERFLEWIPNLLGYVDVAYGDPLPKTRPSLGAIPAFRVSERLRRVFARKIAEPTVRVTPAFEVYVQSELYPARVLGQLERVGELVSADATTVFRLTKQKVAAAQAADHQLDVIKLLESMATTALPDNVRREIAGWSEHSEKFVLYSGFSLLETEPDVAVPERFQVERIDAGTYITRSPDKLFKELEGQERMPVKIVQGDASFAALPDGVRSNLRTKSRKTAGAPVSKPRVTLMKVKRVQLLCPDRDFLQRLHTVLLGAGCPVEADAKNLSLVYSDRYESEVSQAIRGMRGDYQVTIEDKG